MITTPRIILMTGLLVCNWSSWHAVQKAYPNEEDLVPTTPGWTPADRFLFEEGHGGVFGWPEVLTEARPGAYWWWPASAVTEEDITWNLETYWKAGWGNMGVIGIYGVRGAENRFIDIFTPRWFAMFNHAVTEANRLGMLIDLTPSSGWRMGGPHVPKELGEQQLTIENGRIVAKPMKAAVKRPGPGGRGLTINPYSKKAVAFHFDWLARRFDEGHGLAPRAFYYDSFENPGNWCPELLPAFERLRGYSLEEHAAALAGNADPDEVRRVVCDYRETLADLLIDCVRTIVHWGEERGSCLRMQAHGAPANLIDMYAAAGIPETEVFGATQFDIPGYRRDPKWIRPERQSDLVNRFASSAAHVAGRKLVISESFTWLRNHYHTTLAHIKAESDNLFLNGINGIYYHGICFAPQKTAWPGWLFYASTQANARNSIFRDIPALNAYITRCQSVLQSGQPANDVLLYWPIYDLWMEPGKGELRFTVHQPEWIENTPCGEAGRWMMDHGFSFDFISDRQLLSVTCDQGILGTEGRSEYKTILVPAAEYMQVETVQQLLELAKAGATILIWRSLPEDVPGWHNHAIRKRKLDGLLAELKFDDRGMMAMGRGRLFHSKDLESLLHAAGVVPEPMADCGLKCIRRRLRSHVAYFIANHTSEAVDRWIQVASPCRAAVLMDPMTGRTGLAPVREYGEKYEVHLQIEPGETRILRTFAQSGISGPAWRNVTLVSDPVPVTGEWQVEFIEGGPVLPASCSTTELKCWTQFGDEKAQRFAGAARYTIMFQLPEQKADGWYLSLGDVRESARVWINDEPIGIAVAHPFRVDVNQQMKPGLNKMVMEVTNLSANRIRDLDRRGVLWKKFYDINIVDQKYQPLNAAVWELEPSGLLGPVTFVPYQWVQE